jgi:hypothetical protein
MKIETFCGEDGFVTTRVCSWGSFQLVDATFLLAQWFELDNKHACALKSFGDLRSRIATVGAKGQAL